MRSRGPTGVTIAFGSRGANARLSQSHAPSSNGVLLLRQDAIAALVGVLAIVLERDRGGREKLLGAKSWTVNVQLSREGAMSCDVQLFDATGRRRSPATLPEFHAGRAPANKGQRYPADPPTVEEIIAIMRVARGAPYGNRTERVDRGALEGGASDQRGAIADRDRSGATARIDIGQAWQGRSPPPGWDGRLGLDDP
jgi:hypothetical protein